MDKLFEFPDHLLPYKVTVPVGALEDAAVERYTVSPAEADHMNWRIAFNEEDRAWSYAGEYTGLRVGKIMVMSDTAAEITDHLPFIERAAGRVLVTGLGIGMVLKALLRKPEVDHVTVVEVSADVLALVGPHYRAMFGDERLSLIQANAFTWQPPAGAHWDFAWQDIWPLAMGAYWPEHNLLYKHYADYVTHQYSWRAEWMRERWQEGAKPVIPSWILQK